MNATALGYATVQFPWFALVAGQPTGRRVHLIRLTPDGDPGPTLCGIDLTGPDVPIAWIGGGVDRDEVAGGLTVCPACRVARDRTRPVTGIHSGLFP